ncbi:MAG TPA: tetratricopeptide repeat protein [Polyangia bacterium]|jgi:hypothetical protein
MRRLLVLVLLASGGIAAADPPAARIAELEAQVAATDDASPAKAELLHRLAERYRDAGRPAQVIATCRRLVDGAAFQRYARRDEALFTLAYTLQAEQQLPDARRVYQRLIKDFPASRFIPDAYLAFGDYYFEQGDMVSARRFYDKVAQFPLARVHAYALYKRAWCAFNLHDVDAAIAGFGAVREPAAARHPTALERDARLTLAQAWAQARGPAGAFEHFRGVDAALAPAMLDRLATAYADRGRFAWSTQVYEELARRAPGSEARCRWQQAVVKNTLASGGRDAAEAALRRLLATAEEAARRRPPPAGLAECTRAARATLAELARVWHLESAKGPADARPRAKRLCEEYLRRFPDGEEAAAVAYHHAQILEQDARGAGGRAVCEAFDRAVALAARPGADPKLRGEAARAAVTCWKRLVEGDPAAPAAGRARDRRRPKPAPADQASLVAALDAALDAAPVAAERVSWLYLKARTLYQAERLAQAAPVFAEVALGHRRDPVALYAAQLLLDTLNRLGRMDELDRFVDCFLVVPELTRDPEFREVLVKLRRTIDTRANRPAAPPGGRPVPAGCR